MRQGILFTVALGLLTLVGGLRAADADEPRTIVVRADKAYIGDLSTLTGGVRLVIKGNRIVAVTPDRGPLPAGSKVIDRTGCVLVPGFVAAATNLASGPADTPLSPDLVAADGYARGRYREELLKAGITTFHVPPGRKAFLPGQGSLFKPGPRDGWARLVKRRADLFIVLGQPGKFTGAVYDPEQFPDENSILEPARRRSPNSLAGQGAMVRSLLRFAADPKAPAFVKEGTGGWHTAPLKAACKGDLPVRFVCDSAAAVRLAANLAWEKGLNPIIEDTRLGAGRVVDFTGPKPRAVIVRLPVPLWRPSGGSRQGLPADQRPDPGYAARLDRAGIPVILTPVEDRDLADLRFAAGTAVRAGLPASRALAALTSTPARALGVGDRVGTLQAGRDADFLVLSGEPFDARTSICDVWVDGRPGWQAPKKERTLVLKAGKVVCGDGRVFEPGMVIVREGRVVAAGADLPVPTGAQVIARPEGVITPGFIDADSRMGLKGTVSTRRRPRFVNGRLSWVTETRVVNARYGPDVDLANLIDVEQTDFKEALRSGVTGALITSDGSAGRGTLTRTVKPGKECPVVDATATLNLRLTSAKVLAGLIKKAQAYGKKWDDWKKAYGAWKTKRFGPAERPAHPFVKPKATPKKATTPKPTAAKKPTAKKATPAGGGSGPAGNWTGTLKLGGRDVKSSLRLMLRQGRLMGMMTGIRLTKNGRPFIPLTGTYKDGTVNLQARTRSGQTLVVVVGKLAGDTLTGTIEIKAGKGAKGTFKYTRAKGRRATVWIDVDRVAAHTTITEYDDDLELEDWDVPPELENLTEPLPLLPVPGLAILAVADPISGAWAGQATIGGRMNLRFTMVLKLAGTRVTGTFTPVSRGRRPPRSQPVEGTYSGGTFKFAAGGVITGEATVSANKMEGNLSLGPMKGTFTATRSGGGDGSTTGKAKANKSGDEHESPPGGAPAAPGRDEKLEPWLQVLRGEAALVLHPASATALKEALAGLAKLKIKRIVVLDGAAARECRDALRQAGAGVLVRIGAAFDDEWSGPGEYTAAGIPVLFGSGAAIGSSYLGVQAAYAVRRNMCPKAALMALTGWPGRYLGGAGQGTFKAGGPADLVIWSGDPFDLGSTIEDVLVHGKVVYHNHD